MKIRLVGKIVCGSLCIVFAVLALIYASEMRDIAHILRGVLFAIMSLTSTISYRHFEY